MKILITGCAGFIGYSLTNYLLKNNNIIVYGIDNIDTYYDVKLKLKRLSILKKNKKFFFKKIDLIDKKSLEKIFETNKINYVINLAAQAGVRHSIEDPKKYFDSNILGFFNILNLSKDYKIKHLIYASTSSVYGDSKSFPLKEDFNTDKPESFYASSKKCNEVMAYSYSSIYKIPTTGLRFFTVYGPYGRPDMALFKFTKLILSGKKIDVYNKGKHTRDWTYIDDIVKSINKIIHKIPRKKTPYQIINIGSNNPRKLNDFINILYKLLGKRKNVNFLNFQKGDVKKTHASISKLFTLTKFKPKTDIETGIKLFIDWYKKFYKN